jgi:hypothetical protein
MGHCYHHALSSVKKWGGTPEDFLPLHQWFDESKSITADFRHRALRHHAEGIFMLERFFGPTLTLSTGRVVPVRLIGEQHVREDLGFIPSFADFRPLALACRHFANRPCPARRLRRRRRRGEVSYTQTYRCSNRSGKGWCSMKHNEPSILYIDQFGTRIWARTVKQLRERAGGGRVSKMYVHKLDGRTVHVGYVVGRHWFAAYAPVERPAYPRLALKGRRP